MFGNSICNNQPCPAWVNLTRGDMFFADGNEVFVVVNISCTGENICNSSANVDANFSEIGVDQLVHGVFKQNGTNASWAVFEFNTTANFSAIGTQGIQLKNVTFNATVFNNTSGSYSQYELNISAPVVLVNMSTFGCPPPGSEVQFPQVPGYNIYNDSYFDSVQPVECTENDTLCQYMDIYGPGTWNGTHWLICAPNFGGETTNLTEIADTGNFSAIQNFTIEVPEKGKLVFLENVSFSTPEKANALMDFAINSIMGGGRIGFNATRFNGLNNRPNLNLSAIITIYNISGQIGQIQGRPQILKYSHLSSSGIPCPPSICSDFVFDGENVTFVVNSFSDYGISDLINVTLNNPANLSYVNTLNINFTYTPEWNTSLVMDNCTLYGNFTNNWASNESNSTPLINGVVNWINNTVDSDGPYSWNIYCYNDSNQYDYYSINWTVIVDTVKPTFENNNSNVSSINSTQPVLIYANWSDDNELDYAWLSTNETGNWVNYTDGTYNSPININLTAGETWSNFTWGNDTFEGGVVAWRIYANDSADNVNVTGIMTFTVNDTIAPRYSNNQTNTTLTGVPTLFSLKWIDNGGLSGFIFSYDSCGGGSNFLNDSWVPFTGTVNWSNVTKTPNYTANCNVSWRVYTNDTSNNWNSTPVYSYLTKNATGLYCSQDNQCIEGYCVHNVCRASSTYCGDGYCDTGENCLSDNSACASGYACTNGCVATSTTSTSTGGISGSTISTPVIRLGTGKVNITMSILTTSGKMIAKIARYKDVAIRGMNITVVNNVANIKIMISKLQILPSTIPYDINGKVYHYINIEKINITDSDVNKISMNFAVNKTWLEENNIDPLNVTIYRWANNQWKDLNATKTGEDDREVFYYAESPGLSVFVIGTRGGIPEILTEEEVCEENWQCTDWSSCINGMQTRTCTDTNNCGTTIKKPIESRSCEVEKAITEPTTISIITSVIIIVVAVLICVFIFLERIKITSYLENFYKKIKSKKKAKGKREKLKVKVK